MAVEEEEQVEKGSFDKFKDMQLPRSVVVGKDALENVAYTCSNLKLKENALIVCDETTKQVAGDRTADILEDNGYSVEIEIISDATQKIVDDIQENANRKVDFILGVGGGRPIDVSKYSSHLLDIPFISVPTTASHDGIASARASINRDGNKLSVGAQSPLAVVADTEIIAESPFRLLASGYADIVANATAVKDWKLAKRLKNENFSRYAANLSEMTAYSLIDKPENIKKGLQESAWLLVKALVSSGVAMSIAGSSRPASGSEHKFSHSLDKRIENPALHGEQCGVGTIIMMYLHGGDWKRIKYALETVGAPTTARGLDMTEEEVIMGLMHAPEIRPERYTILCNKNMGKKAAEEAARETGVI